MKSDFEAVRQQIDILDLAQRLLQHGKGYEFRYPNEQTCSIRIYPETQSFYDYGRATGGDCFKLYSHTQGGNNWQALQSICTLYGINAPDRKIDRQQLAEAIKTQQRTRQEQLEAKAQHRREWVETVDKLKAEEESLKATLESGQLQPLSDEWCSAKNRLTLISGKLDLMCGIF